MSDRKWIRWNRFNKINCKVESYNLSTLELKSNGLSYRNKAFIAIKDFIKENNFPTNYKIAWY